MRDVPTSPREISRIRTFQKSSVKPNRIEARLFWLLRVLWENDLDLKLLGITTVVDELERLLENEPKTKDMISPYISSVLADLAIITECIRQLEIYQPWAQVFERVLVNREEGIKKEFTDNTKPWADCLKVIQGPNEAKIVSLCDVSDRKFYYPVDKNRTRDNTEAMIRAEKRLDEFWDVLDANARCATAVLRAQP